MIRNVQKVFISLSFLKLNTYLQPYHIGFAVGCFIECSGPHIHSIFIGRSKPDHVLLSFFIFMYVQWESICAHECRYLKKSEKGIRSPGTGVRGSSVTPDVDARNGAQVLFKKKHTFNCWAPLPQLMFYIFLSATVSWQIEAKKRRMCWRVNVMVFRKTWPDIETGKQNCMRSAFLPLPVLYMCTLMA